MDIGDLVHAARHMNAVEERDARRTVLQRVLREPLLHFLLLGALLFAVYALLNRGAMSSPDRIVVDQPRIHALARNFQQVWQRPPRACSRRIVASRRHCAWGSRAA